MMDIIYALAGEGRGHATRARTVADGLLKNGRRIVFLTGGDAISFLRDIYQDDPRVRFIEIPILRFKYTKSKKGERVSFLRTAGAILRFMAQMRRKIRNLSVELQEPEYSPGLIIADYEPLAARLASKLHVPFVTVDSQHYFAHARLKFIPPQLWFYVCVVKLTCRWMAPGRHVAIISKFIPASFIRKSEGVHAVGPLIRPEIRARKPENKGFLLCYFRPSIESEALSALHRCKDRAIVYGLGARPNQDNVEFREISSEKFANDLISCRAVIGTAGSQLMSEALFLRKPLCVIPEPGQIEQIMNAELGRKLGVSIADNNLEEQIRRFIEIADQIGPQYPKLLDGSETAVELLLGLSSGDFSSASQPHLSSGLTSGQPANDRVTSG